MCGLCEKRGKTWNGDDPKCAFDDGIFNRDNWNCATMNLLREIAEEQGQVHFCNDTRIGVLQCDIELPDGMFRQGWIAMVWYKRRGRTSSARVLYDDYPTQELTLEVAEKTIEHLRQFYEKRAERDM